MPTSLGSVLQVFKLGTFLGWQDVKQAYRRSALGPFWITASMAAQAAAMGLVFSIVFRTPLEEYLPYLTTSIIFFGLISSSINEGCLAFINAEGIIKQLDVGKMVHVLRAVAKNLFTFAHNLVIVPLVFLVVGRGFGLEVLLFVPALALVTVNIAWMTAILGTVSARYRDMPQTITALMTIIYFITPVMWQPNLVPQGTAHLLLGLNPFYHLLQIVRLPVLSQLPTFENWFVCLTMAVCGWAMAIYVLRKYGKRIAYWV